MSSQPGYTIKQVAARTGLSAKTLRKRILAGAIPAETVIGPYGPTYMIAESVVARLGEAPEAAAGPATAKKPAVTEEASIATILTEALRERDESLQESVDALRRQVAELTARIEAWESVEPELPERPLTFWERLFGPRTTKWQG